MKFRKEGEGRDWPAYLPGGRVRTSTFALIVAFCFTWWLHSTYAPAPPAPAVQEAPQVVPPGFVPDPEYTWVPRTNVETRPRTTSRTPTTTTTTETSPTETTLPSDTTTSTAPTTVVDPDGPGPLPATTVTPAPSTSLPLPNRSGITTTTTGLLPGLFPASPAPLPPG